MSQPWVKYCSLGAALLVSTAGIAFGSSHREAPNISGFPKVDSTDVYAFRSYESGREGFVTLLANYIPVQDPYGGPNFFTLDSNAIYEIHIDSDGDAVEDKTYQFKFTNAIPNGGTGLTLSVGGQTVPVALKALGPITTAQSAVANFQETFTLTQIDGDRRSGLRQSVVKTDGGSATFEKPFDNIGSKTFPDYAGYANQFIHTANFPGCSTPGRVFVGQRKEGFAVNLGKVFDLVNIVPVDGTSFPGGITQSTANNIIADKNVTTLALELPISCVTGSGNGVIGVWTSASLPQATLRNPNPNFTNPDVNGGAYVQVSRLGMPLVNELVIGLKDKDNFSASEPKDDAKFATYVTNPTLPAILNVLFKDAVNATLGTSIADIAPNNFPRSDLVAAFLTGFTGVNQMANVTASEMIRLNTGIAPKPAAQQSAFGVAGDDLAGFPNGRRPGDDVVDIELRVAMGALCHAIPVNGTSTNLGLCDPANAPVGTAAFTDGAPLTAADFDSVFPYLKTPLGGSEVQ